MYFFAMIFEIRQSWTPGWKSLLFHLAKVWEECAWCGFWFIHTVTPSNLKTPDSGQNVLSRPRKQISIAFKPLLHLVRTQGNTGLSTWILLDSSRSQGVPKGVLKLTHRAVIRFNDNNLKPIDIRKGREKESSENSRAEKLSGWSTDVFSVIFNMIN